MDDKTNVKLFEIKRVRTAWNENEEEWYFSVVDVVGILTDSPDPKRYWSVLKTRLKQEGMERGCPKSPSPPFFLGRGGGDISGSPCSITFLNVSVGKISKLQA
jgi:hypothetical protein